MDNISWSALEYEHREKSGDWFWALGIIVFASAATAIIYANYFFAALLILSGVLLGFFARKEPEEIQYLLDNKGLKAGSRFYPYENIKAFWVEVENKPKLFVRLDRAVMPNLSIPIDGNMAERIHTRFTEAGVTEEPMQEHHAEKIMEFFGF
jgi:hypothetical protein